MENFKGEGMREPRSFVTPAVDYILIEMECMAVIRDSRGICRPCMKGHESLGM